MALSPTDAEIRTALASAITTAAPLAKVFPWWALGAEEQNWPGYLRSDSDADSAGKKRVHGYVITRSQSTGEDLGTRCVRRSFQYTIFGFHYYATGTGATAGSETAFAAEIDAITDALDNRTTLDAALARIQPITWAFDLKSYGGELLHIGRGLVTVQACY